MVPRSRDWVERLNPDSKLLNFNIGTILILESEAVNECLQLTEILKSKAKPYPPCTYCGFNDHCPYDCRIYLEYEIFGSYDHFTSEHNRVIQIRVCTQPLITMILNTLRERHIREPIWYLDGGCSRSITGVKIYQHKYVEQPGPKVVFDDNSSCITEGYGSINCGGIVFSIVAFVNGLKYSLISISQLCDAKYIVQFDDKQGIIVNANKEIVLRVPIINDVYVLDISSLTPNGACFFSKASKSVNWLWHKRLSYLNFKNINKLAKQSKVLGLPSLVYSKDKPCSACEKGKYKRASSKTKQNFSIRKYLHLFHMDLFGLEKGINYDEIFALVERIKAIKIFLAFATYMNFIVFQMDVKSAFLNGKQKEEVYVKQYPSFESSEFPYYVCKLDKSLYGLKQAPRLQIKQDDKGISICQEQYRRNLIKKYEISNSSSVKTHPLNNLGPDLAGTIKIKPFLKGSHEDKDLEGFKPPTDMEPLTTLVVDPSWTDAKYQVNQTQSARLSDEDDMLEAGEEIDKDILPTDEEGQASVEAYYDENVGHKDQTDKIVKETTKTIDNINKAKIDERAKLLKALNRVSKTLEVDFFLQEDMKKMAESYTTTSGYLSGLTKFINNTKFLELLTKLEGFQSTLNTLSFHQRISNIENTQVTMQSKIFSIKGTNIEMLQASKECLLLPPQAVFLFQKLHSLKSMHLLGENLEKHAIVCQKPPSYNEGEPMQIVTTTKKPKDEAAETPMEQEPKRPTRAVSISIVKPITRPNLKVSLIESASRPPLTDPIFEILFMKKLKKPELIQKLPLVLKVVKKIQDVEHQVLKREHSQKARKAMELRKKRLEQYIWTTLSRIRPKPITYVKIHPNSKLTVLTIYRANDRKNFQVHNPFKFANFRVIELDELGIIIQNKKNKIVSKLMTSLGKRYECLKKIPKELVIQSALLAPEQAQSQSSGRKRKHIELEPETRVPRLKCNRNLHENVSFVNNMVIEEPEYGMFFIDVFGDKAF
uniref:Retrovirus-related Pol polyprotein from transposon TNT 1-94 n=1 Tax=Tanacetum cinerariifolium TaxID=118510 RepID=A0A699H4I5_TANCI|nr:retrovirus-related Pol polyprotein from transposon TNT 1-94 [Tanacetum cinerariifolium]